MCASVESQTGIHVKETGPAPPSEVRVQPQQFDSSEPDERLLYRTPVFALPVSPWSAVKDFRILHDGSDDFQVVEVERWTH